jgi:hypothetical protein
MSIYVISNDLNSKNNLFKIGRTKNTNVDILSKYQRYLSGARLLLWYPSTDCVSDERKLLEMFKSNRGHTPNGFRNEWLNISFVELKSKLDIFFGFSGDDFEEEQKQDRERKRIENEEKKKQKEEEMFNCEYCKREFAQSRNQKQHSEICKEKIKFLHEQQLQTQRDLYEQRFHELQTHRDILQQQYERELQTQREQYERQLQNQQLQIEKLEGQIFEIAKQPKQINNHP